MSYCNRKLADSGLFKKHMPWNLKYSSQDFQHTSTKRGECDLKTLGTAKLRRDFDISNSLPVARRWINMARIERQEVSNKVTYIAWFDHTSVVCSVYEADRIGTHRYTYNRYTYKSHRAEQLFHRMSWAPPNSKSAIPIGFLRILFFFFFFDYPGIFGGLNMVKNSWNVHTHWNPWQLGTPLRLGTRAWHRGSTAPPWKTIQKTWCVAHTYLHVFIWNSVQHIDLIEVNNFCVTCHGLRPTGSRLFRAV